MPVSWSLPTFASECASDGPTEAPSPPATKSALASASDLLGDTNASV